MRKPHYYTLHVQAGCKAAYQADAFWSKFTNIAEDVATGIGASHLTELKARMNVSFHFLHRAGCYLLALPKQAGTPMYRRFQDADVRSQPITLGYFTITPPYCAISLPYCAITLPYPNKTLFYGHEARGYVFSKCCFRPSQSAYLFPAWE